MLPKQWCVGATKLVFFRDHDFGEQNMEMGVKDGV